MQGPGKGPQAAVEIGAGTMEKMISRKALGERGSFYGWYFKCQSGTQTLAVIPAVHRAGRKRTCSIQIITEEQSYTVELPAEQFRRKGRTIFIGRNRFGAEGIRLAVCAPGLRAKGRLDFGTLFPLRYSIMGPFALMPFLECRHSIWSMKHTVRGTVYVNETAYSFEGAQGYWEGDRGRSFPEQYIWTQCGFPRGALMLSVAHIPMAGFHFRGIIAVVLLDGREYRLATYLGAKAVKIQDGLVRVMQGSLELEAELLEDAGKPLRAPAEGDMVRVIHESAACRARYCFRKNGRRLLDFETDRASFEYEYS